MKKPSFWGEKEPALCSSQTVPVERPHSILQAPRSRSCRVHGAPQVLAVLPWAEAQPKALLLTACFCFAVLPWPLIKFQFEVLRLVQCGNTFEKSRPSFVRKLMLLVREKQLSVALFCCSSLTIGLVLMFFLCSKTSSVAGT